MMGCILCIKIHKVSVIGSGNKVLEVYLGAGRTLSPIVWPGIKSVINGEHWPHLPL